MGNRGARSLPDSDIGEMSFTSPHWRGASRKSSTLRRQRTPSADDSIRAERGRSEWFSMIPLKCRVRRESMPRGIIALPECCAPFGE